MNYLLEDGGDFNSELLKAICNTEKDIYLNSCLITAMPLEPDHITLICKHNFNYKSIFEEITKQKRKNYPLETQKLQKNQIKCPYCRNIQNGILPYKKPFSKIIGVNWPPKYSYSTKRCTALIKSGKRKGERCNLYCFKNRCYLHTKKQNIKNVIKKCKGVFKTGKRKGENCTYKANIGEFCKIHKKT